MTNTGKINELIETKKVYCEVLTTTRFLKMDGTIIERGEENGMPYIKCFFPHDLYITLNNMFTAESVIIPHEQFAHRWKDVQCEKLGNNMIKISTKKIGYLYNQRNEDRYEIKIPGRIYISKEKTIRGDLKDISESGAGFYVTDTVMEIEKNDIVSLQLIHDLPHNIAEKVGIRSLDELQRKKAKILEIEKNDYNKYLVHLSFL